MRILIIARGYPNEKYNLNGIFEYDQAKALAKDAHEVIFAAIDMRSIRRWRKWGFESINRDGVNIEALNVPCGRIPRSILHKVSEIALKKLYSRIVEKYGKPDIIHAHFLGYGFTTVSVLKHKKIPIVLTEHMSSMNQEVLPKYLKYAGRKTYPEVDKLLTVSSLLAESINKNFNIKAKVIPNIVDTSSFSFIKKEKTNDNFIFVSIGGLIKRKGMDLLIQAFYEAFRNKKEVSLYIYGEGPERKNLENLINKLNLSKQVFLMGQKERKIIAKKMQESDCFVLASKLETFGVVYIEAMATGLPVIATECGGPEDFVDDNNGLLIPVDDLGRLSAAMKYMQNNIKNYDGANISKSVINRFSPDSIARELTNVYLELLK